MDLNSLPDNLIFKILYYLDWKTKIKIERTCKKWKSLLEYLWKNQSSIIDLKLTLKNYDKRTVKLKDSLYYEDRYYLYVFLTYEGKDIRFKKKYLKVKSLITNLSKIPFGHIIIVKFFNNPDISLMPFIDLIIKRCVEFKGIIDDTDISLLPYLSNLRSLYLGIYSNVKLGLIPRYIRKLNLGPLITCWDLSTIILWCYPNLRILEFSGLLHGSCYSLYKTRDKLLEEFKEDDMSNLIKTFLDEIILHIKCDIKVTTLDNCLRLMKDIIRLLYKNNNFRFDVIQNWDIYLRKKKSNL